MSRAAGVRPTFPNDCMIDFQPSNSWYMCCMSCVGLMCCAMQAVWLAWPGPAGFGGQHAACDGGPGAAAEIQAQRELRPL